MLFASIELARRIEAAERALVAEGTRAARALGLATFEHAFAGGLAAWSGADSPLTKVVGLGFEGLPEERDLARVEAEWRARETPLQVELSALAGGGLAELLSARGYRLVGFENVLARPLLRGAARGEGADIAVARCAPAEREEWLDVVGRAFAAPDAQGVAPHESFPHEALKPLLRALFEARGMSSYLARRAGEPAGGASLRLADGLAQLCGAGTLPAHRRRGVQAALLAHRLACAAEAGAELALVTTSPGSKSQQNVQRAGFELLYARALLRKAV